MQRSLEEVLQDPEINESEALAAVDAELTRLHEESIAETYSLHGLETSVLIGRILERGTPAMLTHILLHASCLSITISARSPCFTQCRDPGMTTAAIRALKARNLLPPAPFVHFLEHAIADENIAVLDELSDWCVSHGKASAPVLQSCIQQISTAPKGCAAPFIRILSASSTPDTLQHTGENLPQLDWKQIVILKSVSHTLPASILRLARRACSKFPKRSYLLQDSAHARMAFHQVFQAGTEALMSAPWSAEREASGEVSLAQ